MYGPSHTRAQHIIRCKQSAAVYARASLKRNRRARASCALSKHARTHARMHCATFASSINTACVVRTLENAARVRARVLLRGFANVFVRSPNRHTMGNACIHIQRRMCTHIIIITDTGGTAPAAAHCRRGFFV